MKLNAYRDTEYYVIELNGELDASSCIILDSALASAVENNENKILIDCTELHYIASAGLGVFMSYLQDFETNNISLVLFNLNPKVRKVFQILGLDELIKIVQTKEEAKSFADES
jgi:anti-sigma B factor antagonist